LDRASCDGRKVSFCNRLKKASMPSLSGSVRGVAGGGGNVLAAPFTIFGWVGRPILPVENVELRDRLDAKELLSFGAFPLFLMLLCVPVLLCPVSAPLCAGVRRPSEVLGLRSSPLPAKGPGAIVSIRFAIFSPPFVRGLSGAYRGSASAYECWWPGDKCSLDLCLSILRGAVVGVGNGGKAQSRLDGRSGDGGAKGRGMGLVALLVKGGLPPGDRRDWLCVSGDFDVGEYSCCGRKGLSTGLRKATYDARLVYLLAAEGLILGGGGPRPGRGWIVDLSANEAPPNVAERSSLGRTGSSLSAPCLLNLKSMMKRGAESYLMMLEHRHDQPAVRSRYRHHNSSI
jgi:hypothetical protein